MLQPWAFQPVTAAVSDTHWAVLGEGGGWHPGESLMQAGKAGCKAAMPCTVFSVRAQSNSPRLFRQESISHRPRARCRLGVVGIEQHMAQAPPTAGASPVPALADVPAPRGARTRLGPAESLASPRSAPANATCSCSRGCGPGAPHSASGCEGRGWCHSHRGSLHPMYVPSQGAEAKVGLLPPKPGAFPFGFYGRAPIQAQPGTHLQELFFHRPPAAACIVTSRNLVSFLQSC